MGWQTNVCTNVRGRKMFGSSVMKVGFHLLQIYLCLMCSSAVLMMLSWRLGRRLVTSARGLLLVVLLYPFQRFCGDDESDWDFGDMAWGSAYGREQRCMFLSNNHYLVSCAGVPVPDNVVNVLHLADRHLRDRLTLTLLCRVLTNEQRAAESKMAEDCRLEEHVHASGEDSKALHVARALVDDLTAEHASLTTGTEQAKAEHNTLATRICEL